MTKLIHNLTNSPNLVERIKGIDRDIDTLNAKVWSIPEWMDVWQSIIDLQDNKQDKLTAWEWISIENNVISNTQKSAEWWNITWNITDQVDLQNELSSISESIPTKTSDLTNDSWFITNSVNNLVNYYLKSETYTQAEVNNLIWSIQSFHYEIYPTIWSITTPLSNVLYLIWPAWTGSDKYEEYVYSNNNFIKIWETSIDLSWYVTIDNLNNALSNYTTTEGLNILLAQKQNVLTAWSWISINSNNEISADTSVLATKTDLNSKQDTLTAWSWINIDSNNEISADTSVLATKTDLNSKQDTLIAWDNIQIASDWKTISATDTKYTAWTWINIDANNVISTTITPWQTYTAWDWINIDANNEISNTLPWPTISATAPTGTEWALWYDTTNDVLKVYNWSSWVEVWNWKQAFFKTQAEYDTLPSSKESDWNLYIIVDTHKMLEYSELILLTPDEIVAELNSASQKYINKYAQEWHIQYYMWTYSLLEGPQTSTKVDGYTFSTIWNDSLEWEKYYR